MSSFITNTQAYNVATENELASVLSHYNSEFVFSVVDEAMKSRFNGVHITATPNAVAAWEQNFKAIENIYGEEARNEIKRVREETYIEIINAICKEFGMNFTVDDSIDIYSAALHLYDLFVCNFTTHLISFFANFIYKERNNLYDSLGLSELKKNKDSSTIYGKKIYKDIKLAVINANIDRVIYEVSNMNIPFHIVISTIFGNNSELKKYYLTIVGTDNNFFNKVYMPVINSDIRPDIITSIRFKLQEILMAHDLTSSEIEDLAQN